MQSRDQEQGVVEDLKEKAALRFSRYRSEGVNIVVTAMPKGEPT